MWSSIINTSYLVKIDEKNGKGFGKYETNRVQDIQENIQLIIYHFGWILALIRQSCYK